MRVVIPGIAQGPRGTSALAAIFFSDWLVTMPSLDRKENSGAGY